MKNISILFLSFILCSSCTKVIDIDLNKLAPNIVIEGAITNVRGNYEVRISRSINFSAPNDYPPVRGAEVTIADNAGNAEKLVETEPGLYKTVRLRGTPGRRYTLTVLAEGKIYTAMSTMPTVVLLENVDISLAAEASAANNIPFYDIIPVFLDPEEAVNYYYFNIYANGKKEKGFFNVKNDIFINGQYNVESIYTEMDISKSDSIKIEMQCIDKGVYDFYYSLGNYNTQDGGTPVNPVNNISGGALGFFSAHTLQTKTVAVKQK